MQNRLHTSYHSNYDSALAAKKELEIKQPNTNFQIRKRKTNFDLVSRVNTTQAKSALEETTGMYTKKKKAPKKPWKKSAEAKRFKMEYRNVESREVGRGKWTPINPFNDVKLSNLLREG